METRKETEDKVKKATHKSLYVDKKTYEMAKIAIGLLLDIRELLYNQVKDV